MKYTYYLTIVFIIFTIIGTIYTYYNINKEQDYVLNKKIDFNKSHLKELKSFFEKSIKERVDLLNSGKMTYDEWIEYNIKNGEIKYGNFKYNFFIYEHVPVLNNNVVKVHANNNYINLEVKDIIKQYKDKLIFTKYVIDDNIINKMYNISNEKYFNTIVINDLDDIYDIITKEYNIFLKYKTDKNIKKEGIIGVSISIDNIDKESLFYYFTKIEFIYILILLFIIYIITVILYYYSPDSGILKYKAYFFMVILLFYLIYFINRTEYFGSDETENTKIEQINKSILSVSFLIGVNIFILNSLHTIDSQFNKKIFIETALIFSLSIIILLLSVFKVTHNITVSQLIERRVTDEILFNFSIFINIIIIFNFMIFIIKKYYTRLENI